MLLETGGDGWDESADRNAEDREVGGKELHSGSKGKFKSYLTGVRL